MGANNQPPMYKMETPVNNVTFGCCTPIRLGMWVNAEVTQRVITSNGYTVQLTPEAVQAIQQKYKGEPLMVQFKRPCTCGDCCKLYCNCSCCKCDFNCPAPVLADTAIYHTIWFARTSSASKCEGFAAWAANNFLCQVPHLCSKICVDKTSITPEQVTLDRNVHPGNLHSLVAQASTPAEFALGLFGAALTWVDPNSYSSPVAQNMK